MTGRSLVRWMFALLAAAPGAASANLCGLDKLDDRYRTESALISRDAFAPASPDYRGADAEYNAWVLACNRERDTKGKEIDAEIPVTTGGSFGNDLPPLIVNGKLNYYGTIFTQLKYAYRLRREQGTWIVTLPISFHFPEAPLKNRLDVSEELALPLNLKTAAGSATGGTRDCDKGRERMSDQKKGGQLLVDIGFIYSDDGPACRLARDRVLDDGTKLLDRYYEFWKTAIETQWSRSGFRVEVRFPDYSSPLLVPVSSALRTSFERDDVTWKIRFSDNPEKRATFKPVPFKWENAPMSMDGATIAHETGHYLGLDDEYREKLKTENQWRDCDSHGGAGYLMCSQVYGSDSTPENDPGGIGHPEAAKGIYAWILTRRYVMGKAQQCASEGDCGAGRYCDKGTLTIGRNQCVDKAASCESCSADRKCADGLECKSGRCVEAGSRALGASCCRDDECVTGSCNKNGQCQCAEDRHCGTGRFCDKGGIAGIGINSCVSQAGECGSCGKDEQCRSGRCAGGRCITAGSVAVGATCCKNEQCTSGACNTDGRCQCTEDRHCPTGQTCDKGGALGIGVNTCVRKGRHLRKLRQGHRLSVE